MIAKIQPSFSLDNDYKFDANEFDSLIRTHEDRLKEALSLYFGDVVRFHEGIKSNPLPEPLSDRSIKILKKHITLLACKGRLEKTNRVLNAYNRSLRAANKILSNSEADLENKNEALNEELNKRQTSIGSSKKALDQANDQIKELKNELEKLTKIFALPTVLKAAKEALKDQNGL